MACIDVFAPERLLTIHFLAEQIWLRAKGKRLIATEVYDFLLSVDDSNDLDCFYVCSPHFCRTRATDGWHDNVYMLPMGAAQTHWGWFYYGNEELTEDGQLLLRVPSPVTDSETSFAESLMEYRGKYVPPDQPIWAESLRSEIEIGLMLQLKKSLYQVKLREPLRKHAGNRMWFRLLVEPVLFDMDRPAALSTGGILQWFFPRYQVATFVYCPSLVRLQVSVRVSELQTREVAHKATIDRIGYLILGSSFGNARPRTSTRVVDHRIFVGGLGISVRVEPPAAPTPACNIVMNLGPQTHRLKIPVYGANYLNYDKIPLVDEELLVYSYAGGGLLNGDRDLVTVSSRAIAHLQEFGPKDKMDLAQQVASPVGFEAGCVLIDKMKQSNLVHVHNSTITVGQVTQENICELRRIYATPSEFQGVENARSAFTDLHMFRLSFLCSWEPRVIIRQLAYLVIAVFSIAAFVISIIGLFR